MDRPLISYIILTYNQERFIREAVESALSQSYSPLEIMISDDCSNDRTFDIAQQIVATYKGPHSVRTNRNHTNLGIGGNLNRAFESCRGELVVAAAGDDLSLPTRTEVIYQAWEHSGRQATSIFSSYTATSEDGTVQATGGLRGERGDSRIFRLLEGDLHEFLSRKAPVVNGCTHAWSPVLFSFFGPLSSDLEDLVLSFRTLAIGKLLYINQPLVKYRRHGSNVSFFAEQDDTRSFEHREKRLRWVDEKSAAAYQNILSDVETLYLKGRINQAQRDRLRAEGERVRGCYELERQMMDGNFFQRVRTLGATVRRGNMRSALPCLPRLLPGPVYRALFLLREKWRALARSRERRPGT